MDASVDPVGILCRGLRQRQWSAIEQRAPSLSDGCPARLASYTMRGLAASRRLLASSRIDQGQLEACFLHVARDSPFAFLEDVPNAAILSTARGAALEQSIFGASTDQEEELSLLLSLFTNLLDGLVDDARAFLAPEWETFSEIMLSQPWAQTGVPPHIPLRSDRHPVVDLLLEVTTEIIRRVLKAPGWADSTLREIFTAAARAAFLAESNSVHCGIGDGQTDFAACANALRAKSVEWSWVVALTPLLLHGWPTAFDQQRYRGFAERMGVYGGWIDDIADLQRDLQQGHWSNVLLAIADHLGQPRLTSQPEWRFLLERAIALDGIADRLVETGGLLYDALTHNLHALGIDLAPLQPVILDVTEAWLETEADP